MWSRIKAEHRVPFSDESPEALAASIGHWMSDSDFCSFQDIKTLLTRRNATKKAISMLSEAWSLLVSDGFIFPDFSKNVEQPAAFYIFRPTNRLKIAVNSGALKSMLSVHEDVTSMIHDALQPATLGQIRQGNYSDAITNATTRLEGRLREISKIENKTLDEMSGIAFGDKGVFASVLDEKTRKNLMKLFQGMTQLIRNPVHHHHNHPINQKECLRLLGFLSYLYEELDCIESKLIDLKPPVVHTAC